MKSYRTLGKSGLRVSPLSLGAMTFGWSTDRPAAKAIFQAYRAAGGNLIDTADLYAGGKSEEWLGEFIQEDQCRDEIVILTKFSFNASPGNPNAGGNGRKNLFRAVEGSLRRLQTTYIDVYMLHVHDMVTPVEEVMAALNDLVRSGKVHYIGLSNVPAWYAARAATIAEFRGYAPISVLQLEYSLVSRNLEREHAPLAKELGIAIMPWSPLGGGLLTGKYTRSTDGTVVGEGRVAQTQNSGNPVMEKFAKDDRNWAIVEALVAIAKARNVSPATIALAWVLSRNQVSSVLLGVSRLDQLQANLAALDITLTGEELSTLNKVSSPVPTELDHFYGPELQGMVNGGTTITKGY